MKKKMPAVEAQRHVRWVAFIDEKINPTLKQHWITKHKCDPIELAMKIVCEDRQGLKGIRDVIAFYQWSLTLSQALALKMDDIVTMSVEVLEALADDMMSKLAREVASFHFARSCKGNEITRKDVESAKNHFDTTYGQLWNAGLLSKDKQTYEFEASPSNPKNRND